MNRFNLAPIVGIIAALAMSATACDPGDDGSIVITPQPTHDFSLTYVSGHLGSYWDCSDEALADPSAKAAGEAPSGAAADRGRCEDGGNCPPFPMNCEHGEVTMEVASTGDVAMPGLSIAAVKIQSPWAADVDSEVLDVTRADGQPLTTPIQPGESVQVIVQFRSLPPHVDAQWFGADPSTDQAFALPEFRVEFTVRSGEVEHKLLTPALATLPVVAT